MKLRGMLDKDSCGVFLGSSWKMERILVYGRFVVNHPDAKGRFTVDFKQH